MRLSVVVTAFLLTFAAAPLLADPGRDGSGHGSRGHVARHHEAERENWKRQNDRAREEHKRQEEFAREQLKREKEWLREERKRAREFEREHGYDHYTVPAYVPYVIEPAYPSEGIAITRDGIDVWFTL